ncbi:MAG: hypothetical protein IK099_07035 [Clostridia bacterium]|nr:hypothetical protein [Clostridia bacterium]
MNSFANSLFSLLFGWVRTITQRIWSSSATGAFGSFFSWLGDHWLWLALVLAICGTAVDMLVWLFRWQPYLIWQSRIRRFTRRLKTDNEAVPKRFDKGYQGGVALEIPKAEEAPEPDWQEPEFPQAAAQEQPFIPENFTEQLKRDADFGGITQERQGRHWQYPEAEPYQPPPIVTESWLSAAYQKSSAPEVRHKRRTEKYEKKKPVWANKLMIPEVEEDSLLDGLPPAVNRQEAFHDPVLPDQNKSDGSTN